MPAPRSPGSACRSWSRRAPRVGAITAVRAQVAVAVRNRLANRCPRTATGCPPGGCGRQAELLPACGLPGGPRDIRGDDIGGVPVWAAVGPLWCRIVVRGSACEAASWTSRSGTPASSAAIMNACLSVCGVTALAITARRATLRTIRPAPCRSSRRPSAARNTGPSVRSPIARSIARAVRGASGTVTTLPPLRVIVSVRCPRSRPRCSMSAPVASETRSPFRASSACSSAEPSPAATSSAPSSLRSSATA